MKREEFSTKYCETVNRAIELSKKFKNHGVWALRCDLNDKMVNNRDIFEYGLQLVIDNNESEFIDKVLSNIIEQEKDEYARTLKRIQKEAVLMIQKGTKLRLIRTMLNSFTDFKLDEPCEKSSNV
ncbi:hypothetical protein R84B8_01363 [Treponema sp. R8-4-B8]